LPLRHYGPASSPRCGPRRRSSPLPPPADEVHVLDGGRPVAAEGHQDGGRVGQRQHRAEAHEPGGGNRITLRGVHPANGRMMTVKPKIVVAEPGVELR
jgi:hypothetical protein